MQSSFEEKLNSDHDLSTEMNLSGNFREFLKIEENSKMDDEKLMEYYEYVDNLEDEDFESEEEGEQEEEEEEEEFSFVCGKNAAEDAFNKDQMKTVFPLFNRDLLLSGGDLDENLPMRPPVKKVFVETNEENRQVTSFTPGNDEISGPYCEWSSKKAVETSPEVCKKSNSTGFSKIWRLKELTGRCNSDGRDAFIFLNSSHAPSTSKQQTAEGKSEKKESMVKISQKLKKSGKSKTASLSAHEVYLRSKAKDERRRPSYLPYRPELVGFFTNVSAGLTRNVHPY